MLPASVFSMLGLTESFPALASSTGHAHEMLFGFTLAVVAGNQLGPMAISRLIILVGFWMIARVSFLTAPQSMLAAMANIIFAVLLAWHIAPRLFGAAKKWRNQALPLVLTAICVSGIAFYFIQHVDLSFDRHMIIAIAVLLFSTLMLFMGGRLIAPTVAGQLYRQGDKLNARVQPHIEGALLVTMAVAISAKMFTDGILFTTLVSFATIIAGVLALVRLLRWRLWALQGRLDLLCLATGYLWLAIGLFIYGLSIAVGLHQSIALHIITVGALGTLTLNVMSMTWTLKARLDPTLTRIPVWATLLIAAATIARVLASFGVYNSLMLLQFAALCWSAAFTLLFIRLLRIRFHRN